MTVAKTLRRMKGEIAVFEPKQQSHLTWRETIIQKYCELTMQLRCRLGLAVISAGVAAATMSQAAHAQDRAWERMLKASETEQAALVVSYLNRGMPVVDPDGDVFIMLVLNKSSITLPLVERKIEEVLQSQIGRAHV